MESEASGGGRLRSMIEGARGDTAPPLPRIAAPAAGGLQDIEPFDRAMTLAVQAFTSLFPLVIAFAALRPDSAGSPGDRLSDTLGLPDSSRPVLEQVLPAQPETRGVFGILGVVIVVISATSLSRRTPACTRRCGRCLHPAVGLAGGAGSPFCSGWRCPSSR